MPVNSNSPIFGVLMKDFDLELVDVNVRLATNQPDRIDLVAMRHVTSGKTQPAIIAWQRNELENPITRLQENIKWIREHVSEFKAVFASEFGSEVLNGLDWQLLTAAAVFTNRSAYMSALLDPASITDYYHLVLIQPVENSLTIEWMHAGELRAAAREFADLFVDEAIAEAIEKDDFREFIAERTNRLLEEAGLDPLPNGVPDTPWNASPRHRFLTQLRRRSLERTDLHRAAVPSQYSLRRYIGEDTMAYTYNVANYDSRAGLWIPDTAEYLFNYLLRYKAMINAAVGLPLHWGPYPERGTGYEISRMVRNGGSRSAESGWPQIHRDLVDAMIRIERALRPYLIQYYDPELRRIVENDLATD